MMVGVAVLKGDSIREVILGNEESKVFDVIEFNVTNVVKGEKKDILDQTSLQVNYAVKRNERVYLSYVKGDVVGAFSFIHVPVCPKFEKMVKHRKIDDLVHALGKAHYQFATVMQWAFFSKLEDGYQVCFLVVHINKLGEVVGLRFGEGKFSL
jgi:hypothetical protein